MISIKQGWIMIATLAVLSTGGCNKGTQAYTPKPSKKVDPVQLKPGEESSLFPVAVGNTWVFATETGVQSQTGSGSNKGELTFRVTEVSDTPNGKKVTIEVSADGATREKQVWQINSKGIYQLSTGTANVAFNPPQPIVVWPLNPGAKFNWAGTGRTPGGGQGKSTSVSTVRAPEEIDTDMGRMSAIPIESRTEGTGMNPTTKKMQQMISYNITWWVPKVGIVRYRQELAAPGLNAVQILKIKSHTLK